MQDNPSTARPPRVPGRSGIAPIMTERARELRGRSTSAEKLLWSRLKNRGCGGVKFRRQHVVGPFIADFYAFEVGLLIELDGSSHETRQDSDATRDAWICAHGIAVLRFMNQEILEDIVGVAALITSVIADRQRSAPHPALDQGIESP